MDGDGEKGLGCLGRLFPLLRMGLGWKPVVDFKQKACTLCAPGDPWGIGLKGWGCRWPVPGGGGRVQKGDPGMDQGSGRAE